MMEKADREKLLRHMVGARREVKKRDWGYRNRYAAARGTAAHKALEAMSYEGLVEEFDATEHIILYRATAAGCEIIGLTAEQTKKALEPYC